MTTNRLSDSLIDLASARTVNAAPSAGAALVGAINLPIAISSYGRDANFKNA